MEGAAAGARCSPQLAAQLRQHYSTLLGTWRAPGQWPLVYSERYNIGLLGIEKLHPFDSSKFRKVVNSLQQSGLITKNQLVAAGEVPEAVLRSVHSAAYLDALRYDKAKVAEVMELPLLARLPMFLLQSHLLCPMRYHVGGTMLAAALAVECGWAINIGGGLHHAYYQDGGGWCPFADITAAALELKQATNGTISSVTVIDLDVHQGNGHERDKLHHGLSSWRIVDVYNAEIYPGDGVAKAAIDVNVELRSGTRDAEYLAAVESALKQCFAGGARPDLVIYNAGTDVMAGDPLGRLAVSEGAVVRRDQLVWQAARDAGAPICMLLSGGYTRNNYKTVARSLENLITTFKLLDHPYDT